MKRLMLALTLLALPASAYELDTLATEGDSINFSAVVPNSTGEGIILPQSTTCSGTPTTGSICYGTTNDELCVFDGGAYDCTALGAAGGIDGLEDLETPTNDAVPVGNGTTFDMKVVPDCDADNQTLQYDQATNAFSCGDDDAGTTDRKSFTQRSTYQNTLNTLTTSACLSQVGSVIGCPGVQSVTQYVGAALDAQVTVKSNTCCASLLNFDSGDSVDFCVADGSSSSLTNVSGSCVNFVYPETGFLCKTVSLSQTTTSTANYGLVVRAQNIVDTTDGSENVTVGCTVEYE